MLKQTCQLAVSAPHSVGCNRCTRWPWSNSCGLPLGDESVGIAASLHRGAILHVWAHLGVHAAPWPGRLSRSIVQTHQDMYIGLSVGVTGLWPNGCSRHLSCERVSVRFQYQASLTHDSIDLGYHPILTLVKWAAILINSVCRDCSRRLHWNVNRNILALNDRFDVLKCQLTVKEPADPARTDWISPDWRKYKLDDHEHHGYIPTSFGSVISI